MGAVGIVGQRQLCEPDSVQFGGRGRAERFVVGHREGERPFQREKQLSERRFQRHQHRHIAQIGLVARHRHQGVSKQRDGTRRTDDNRHRGARQSECHRGSEHLAHAVARNGDGRPRGEPANRLFHDFATAIHRHPTARENEAIRDALARRTEGHGGLSARRTHGTAEADSYLYRQSRADAPQTLY